MKAKWLPITVAVVSALSAQAAVSAEAAGIDYYGYFRSGLGYGDSGSMKDAVGGSFEKKKVGRLGNEFDTYAEVGFGKELKADETKSVYIQTMFNMYDGDTNSNMENKFGWENLNMQLRNFMGLGETSWIGIRQYNKGYSISSNDLDYWNSTNVGGGIEGMKLGQGKLSVAALHRDIADTYISGETDPEVVDVLIDSNQLELTYDSLPVWNGATLAMGYKFLNADATADQITNNGDRDYADGHSVLLEVNQSLLGTGFNRTVLQYYADGTALQGVLYGTADTLNGDVESGDGFAIRNYGVIPLAADWDLSHAINYAEANSIKLQDGDEGDASAFAVSAKVTYHWSDITRTYVEAGYFDDEKTVDGDDKSRNGSKTTVAQAFSFGRGEPELRVFASYLNSDNEDWDSSHAFDSGTADDTWTVGLQANVFW